MGEDNILGFTFEDNLSSMEEEGIFFEISKEEKDSFDISKNNLETLDDFIQFFEAFGSDVDNEKDISNYLDKLEYLGYSFKDKTIIDYTNINTIKTSIIQFAFLINLSMNTNCNYKPVKICFFACLELLKEYNNN